MLAEQPDCFWIFMLVPVLDGLSKKQVVVFLFFTLASVSHLCGICGG